MQMQQVTEKKNAEEQFHDICRAEVIYEEEADEEGEEFQIEDFEQTPPKMEDNKPQVHDPTKNSILTLWKSQGLLISVLFYPLT